MLRPRAVLVLAQHHHTPYSYHQHRYHQHQHRRQQERRQNPFQLSEVGAFLAVSLLPAVVIVSRMGGGLCRVWRGRSPGPGNVVRRPGLVIRAPALGRGRRGIGGNGVLGASLGFRFACSMAFVEKLLPSRIGDSIYGEKYEQGDDMNLLSCAVW